MGVEIIARKNRGVAGLSCIDTVLEQPCVNAVLTGLGSLNGGTNDDKFTCLACNGRNTGLCRGAGAAIDCILDVGYIVADRSVANLVCEVNKTYRSRTAGVELVTNPHGCIAVSGALRREGVAGGHDELVGIGLVLLQGVNGCSHIGAVHATRTGIYGVECTVYEIGRRGIRVGGKFGNILLGGGDGHAVREVCTVGSPEGVAAGLGGREAETVNRLVVAGVDDEAAVVYDIQTLNGSLAVQGCGKLGRGNAVGLNQTRSNREDELTLRNCGLVGVVVGIGLFATVVISTAGHCQSGKGHQKKFPSFHVF